VAFAGGAAAVSLTYVVGARFGGRSSGTSIVLAGVAVAALFTATQTFLQQQHAQDLQTVYSWILGSLSVATWSDVWLILPYAIVSAAALLMHRRLLDVLRLSEEEVASLGVNPARVRLAVVAAATLGTAAAVSVSGLIGFVGIIVPHLVRLTTNASYRVVLPVSMVGGAAFLILADLVARTVESPAEVPLGVITAFVGGPFFIFVLRSRRAHQGVL
jgi:iron complex transport system permease protein